MKSFVTSLALLAAAPVAAQTGYYVATPAIAPVKARLVTRATAWTLHDGAYVAAARASERDAILCALVAKDAGALASFSAGGRAFDAGRLAACNAHAKRAPAVATAAR